MYYNFVFGVVSHEQFLIFFFFFFCALGGERATLKTRHSFDTLRVALTNLQLHSKIFKIMHPYRLVLFLFHASTATYYSKNKEVKQVSKDWHSRENHIRQFSNIISEDRCEFNHYALSQFSSRAGLT